MSGWSSTGVGRLAGLFLLLVLPLSLRWLPIGHGLPQNHVPDTHVVRCALGMAKDKDPFPPVGRYSTYPYLLPYTLLPVYAAQYAVGRATGEWSGSGEFANRVLEHPEDVHLTARLVLAALSALAPWLVYRGARVAGLRSGAWIAAWLVATGLLHLHFSVQERPWGPMMSFLALSIWPAARYVRGGALRDLLLCGAAGGLAVATHQAGLPLLLVAGIAWFAGPHGFTGGASLRRRLGHGLVAVGAFALVGLLLGYPYRLVHGATDAGQVAGIAEAGESAESSGGVDLTLGGQGIAFDIRWESLEHLSRALVGYDPVLVLLGVAGIALSVRRRVLWPAVGMGLFWFAFFGTNQNDHVRYMLPMSVLLAYPAGLAGERLVRSGNTGRALLLLLLAVPLIQALRLVHVLRQEDTRTLALAPLGDLPAGTVVAIDRYGPQVPMNRASLELLAGLRPLGSREAHRLELLEASAEYDVDLDSIGGPGIGVVPVGDLFEFDERHRGSRVAQAAMGLGDGFDEVLRGLGVTHVLLVDRDPTDDVPSLLVDEGSALLIERGQGRGELAPKLSPLSTGRSLWTIDPALGASGGEARLPTELDFAATAIWRVERPGPRLELRALGG
ncbi:glycosyltransferase family 39 protein [Engelhardtia mirabilis]|uniref:Glycosyltransferase RgtA/B/C/D-like domain-containing protein n=1 Tax=Engelhardtia mirabilis TaxID=2528011 RepID=A0A518BJ82_9BACT|nr:hypothetical protein Pla133_21100 [Planctomycetes bacterium Pla133]QDV01359.1 hypothetical protein Pla86_21100 [Planctomycetes bacterium Pla86]